MRVHMLQVCVHFLPVCEFLVISCNCSHCENGSFEVLSLHSAAVAVGLVDVDPLVHDPVHGSV